MPKLHLLPLVALGLLLPGTSTFAAPAAEANPAAGKAAEAGLDDVSAQAAKLEAALAKLRDSSPDAADLLVQLADLYYADGRVFGLIRVSETFVTKHSSHPKHRDMMVKLIDALLAMSRNKELTATSRQFLTRYPNDNECLRIEKIVAAAFEQLGDRMHAADTCMAIWQRQKGAPEGRNYGAKAIGLYMSLNSAEGFIKAAEAAELVLEPLPPGEFAVEIGMQGFHNWRRVNNWAKSNVAGNKILAKNLPLAPGELRDLHYLMSENYSNQNQRANAVESLRKARALGDRPDWHVRMITEMHNANATPAEMEPVVNEYVQKYPAAPDRYAMRSYLAQAYLRAMNKGQALAIMAEVMPFDASTNSSAVHYVQQNGTEPAQLAQSEQVLRDALGKNAKDAALLRWILGSELYRDRIKDLAKARQMFSEVLSQSPTNDGNTQQPLYWLLYNPSSEDDFHSVVAQYLKQRATLYEWSAFRNFLAGWINEASQNKDHQAHAAWAKTQLGAADQDPALKDWLAVDSADPAQAFAARVRLFAPDRFKTLNENQANTIWYPLTETFRNSGDPQVRMKGAEAHAQMAARFPHNWQVAVSWLSTAFDNNQTELAKAATLNLLKMDPPQSNSDIWRRMYGTADKLADAEMVKQIFAWQQKSIQKYGFDWGYADQIGDALDKFGLKAEAIAYWQRVLAEGDPNNNWYAQSAQRMLARLKDAEWGQLITKLLAKPSDYHGLYSQILASAQLGAKDLDGFEKTLAATRTFQNERPFRAWGMDPDTAQSWTDSYRNNKDAKPEDKRRVYTAVKSLGLPFSAPAATLALLELDGGKGMTAMQRLLAYEAVTLDSADHTTGWDRLVGYAQAAMARKDYAAAATLATGMLANVSNVDAARIQAGRDMVGQSYARMGGVGLTIDESSPIAPLLQAALYLRLGDERLALETYSANKALFDQHRSEMPVDLILFVGDSLVAAGGDENLDRAEDILRGWLVKNSEVVELEDGVKAAVQLLLAKTYYKAQRYEVARSEYTTVINRFPKTAQAIEAEFGIGESFMAQKVYDQAAATFEKLAASQDRDVVIRAEFLRGVLANRRGDRDEARDIFRNVLDRVPNVELANQALFNLAEVYGAEERYIDQLELLRTVGRLGRTSKRWHTPGTSLSIVVQDSDLGISRGHARIPVRVTTEPGGDEELIYLYSGGAGKGLFRADLDTRLGQATKHDKVLELTGRDVIKCDYPEEFKAEFRSVPLSDAEIRVAANAKLDVSGSKVIDVEAESFSQRLERETRAAEAKDQRLSQNRPANQIKPGNSIYLRVQDADRDLSNEPDKLTVKIVATSGDQVQLPLIETGDHTGVFEATAATGELPAGALASDTAIDHSPLMAIDQDKETAWLSEPDGATPKWLAVDMKDLKNVSRVTISSPDAKLQAPVRGELRGSHDGKFWFRIASQPPLPPAEPVAGPFGPMGIRVYAGNFTQITDWKQVVELTKGAAPPIEQGPVEQLAWKRAPDAADVQQPFAVVWQGKIVQARSGAARIAVAGNRTALMLDGSLELPVGDGNRTVDVWLDKGPHELTIFSAIGQGGQGASAAWAKAEATTGEQVSLIPLRAIDFDLDRPEAKIVADAPQAPVGKDIELTLEEAQLTKKSEQFAIDKDHGGPHIGNWKSIEDSVSWNFEAAEPGVYDVLLNISHNGEGGQFRVEFGKQALQGTVPNTGSWEKYLLTPAGSILVSKAGNYTLALKALEVKAESALDLIGITLRPAVGSRTIVAGGTWAFRFPPRDLRHVKFVVQEYLGEAVAVNRMEIGSDKPGEIYIPTKTDVLSLAGNDRLEIAAGDTITATYTDEFTQTAGDRSQLLSGTLAATYFNGSVKSIAYDFIRRPNGSVETVPKLLMRIDPGERFIVEITDYDRDTSGEPDQVKLAVAVNDGDPIELVAQETKPYSGVFTKEIDTASAADGSKLVVQPGDRIVCRYLDEQNTFPGHAVVRENVVYVNRPTSGKVRVVESRVIRPPQAGGRQSSASAAALQTLYLPAVKNKELNSVAFEAPLTVEVIDPDAAKNSRSHVMARLDTTSGASINVRCVIASDPVIGFNSDSESQRVALEEGRFVGQVLLQLGGKNSPDVVPVTASMPRNLLGGGVLSEEEASAGGETLVTRVLNVSGKDVITATYSDTLRPKGKPVDLSSRGRLIANGTLACTDHDYEKPVTQLHVGEKLFLMVNDADLDISDERDTARVAITSERGESESMALEETLSHSGIFTGSIALRPSESPTAGNLDPADPAIETYFGDELTVKYVDRTASTEDGKLEVAVSIPVVVGTDGLVAAFSKLFDDEALAVETQFHIAESCFELFKSHKALGRKDEQRADLEAGRRVLREVMEDYPNPKYIPRIAYLLGQFAQELAQWDEAINSYQMIVRQYPDSTLAADAQYKLAQCYEESNDFENALEAYVTLAATYPKSPLIANVMVRISDHFYKKENFEVSAQVGEKFLERFDGHEWAARMAFRVGQCYYKGKQFAKASAAFDKFAKTFPDDALCADALFWSGESYRMATNTKEAFRSYNICRWRFPASEAAKYARGRLALPEMLQQFEAEATTDE
jgi:TolA-binding protein